VVIVAELGVGMNDIKFESRFKSVFELILLGHSLSLCLWSLLASLLF